MTTENKKTSLVSPLDWGLGHATRCIPIIRELLSLRFKVIIAASDRSFDLLQLEFPDLTMNHIAGYEISYPNHKSMVLTMLQQFPRLLRRIAAEKREVMKIIAEHGVDGIIADNRFGLGISGLPTAYITHQIKIPTPPHLRYIEPLLKLLHRRVMKRYGEVWIPDYSDGSNLSGNLSHDQKLPSKSYFIGPLSRFSPGENEDETLSSEILVIISGPEPQRTMFEWMILRQLDGRSERVLVVRGTPESQRQVKVSANITVVDHLPADKLNQAMNAAGIVVARSGYSTIMDLSKLGKQAILIPTPGQTEQEYLAELLKSRNICYCEPQDGFDLERSLSMVSDYSGFNIKDHNNKLLRQRIESLFGSK